MAEQDQDQDRIYFERVDKVKCPACNVEMDVAQLEPFSRAACPSCGAEIDVPGRLSGYLLRACLGSGGMGSVYRAYDETLDREVAIKVMKKSLGSQAEFLDSFRREAQSAAKLNHPNIAQIYSFGEENGQPYIVMEFVPGKHLDDMIEAGEPLDQAMVMKIGMDIADGLQLATASNLIHGDIKPGNILLDGRDSPKLVDFGIASSPDAEQSEIWGTPYYISPEKIRRQKVDFRSDMYCLGGTLYHAITKHPPFDGEDAKAVVKARLNETPRPMREFRADVNPEVERVIMKMLEREPQNRYSSYGELMADMRACLEKLQKQPVAAGSGGASKRIVIKGRGTRSGLAPVPETQVAAESAAPATGGGRIRIAKKHGTIVVPHGDGNPISQESEQAEPPKKKSLGKVLLTVAAVLLVLVVGGGVTAMSVVKANRRKALQERMDLVAGQGNALAPILRIGSNAAKLAGNIAKYGETASSIVDEAVAIAEKVSGPESAAGIRAEEPFAFEPFDDTVETVLRGAGDGEDEPESDGGAADAGQEAGAADAPPITDEMLAQVPEEMRDLVKKAAAGEMSPEELMAAMPENMREFMAKAQSGELSQEELLAAMPEEMKAVAQSLQGTLMAALQAGMQAGIDEPMAQAVSDDAGGGESGEVAEAQEGMDELSLKAREIFVALAPVRRAQAFSALATESIYGLCNKAIASTNVSADVATAKIDDIKREVSGNIELLGRIAEKASERYGQLEDMTDGFEKIIKDARRELDALKTASAAVIAENERRAAEEKAAEEARAERERKEAEEAARKAAEDSEIARVRAVVPSQMENVLKWKFDPVLRDLDKLEGQVQTKPGKKALKVEKRRVEALKALKAFLIARLNGNDRFVHRKDKWSVVSADERALEIKPARKDMKPQRLKWEELSPEQIVPMLMYYLFDREKAKDIPLRERISGYTNSAVYFMVVRGDDDNARKAAEAFVERVGEESPSRKGDAEEMLYELEFAESDE